MQYLYYTIAAILLYFGSDLILLQIEKVRGKPFAEQRSLMFLLIITVLAVSTFKLIAVMVNN